MKIRLSNLALFLFISGLLYIKQPNIFSFCAWSFGVIAAFIKLDFSNNIASSKFFTGILLISLLVCFVALPSNMVFNGGFEKDLYGWTPVAQFYKYDDNGYAQSNVNFSIGGQRRTGGKSLHIGNRQESGDQRYGMIFQPLEVIPNASYSVSFYVKGNLGKESLWVTISDDWANDKARYYVDPKQYISWQKINPEKRLIADDSRYAQFKIISTAPGSYYIDDVSMRVDIIDTVRRYIIRLFCKT